MAQLTRKNIKLFAGNSASNQTGEVGTYKLGSANVVFSKDPDVIQAGEWENGMANTLQSDYAPFLEEYNSIIYCMCYFLKQLAQTGIMQYDASEEYYVGSYAISTVDGYLYRSLQGTSGSPNTGNEPSVSPTYWELQDFKQKVNLNGDNATFSALSTTAISNLTQLYTLSSGFNSSGYKTLSDAWNNYKEIIIVYGTATTGHLGEQHYTFYTNLINASDSVTNFENRLSIGVLGGSAKSCGFNFNNSDKTKLYFSGDLGDDDHVSGVYGRYKIS